MQTIVVPAAPHAGSDDRRTVRRSVMP